MKDNIFPKYEILSVGVHAVTMENALQQIQMFVADRATHLIATANAEMIMKAQNDKKLASFLGCSDLVVPDGAGVIWAGEQLGFNFPERVAGIDLMVKILEKAPNENWPIYFLGGAPGVAQKVADRFRSAQPKIKIVGIRDGYFESAKNSEIINDIKNSGARLLFIGLGVPKQEYWLLDYADQLDCITAIGVGGSFDVLAGNLQRAPLWMQRNRLEWFYRLLLQPSRITRMLELPRFVYKVKKVKKSKLTRD